MAETRKMALAWKILIGMALGIIVGLLFMGKEGFFTPATVTTWIRPFGTLFIRLLTFVVVPVVFFSLISGILQLKDVNKVGSIGGKIIVFYVVTSVIALTIGFIVSLSLRGFYPAIESLVATDTNINKVDVTTTIIELFPGNIIAPFASAAMVPLIMICIAIGISLLSIGEKGDPFKKFIESGNEVFMKIMLFIVNLSPFGVFALMAWATATNGPQIFGRLAILLGGAYLAYIIHLFVTYSIAVKGLGGMSPLKFFKGMWPAMIMAFSSASSLASLPLNIKCAKDLGCREHIVDFTLPLGANINSDGTAIYQSLAAVFIACCYGIDLSIGQMLMIIFTATAASFGIAGVPGAGMVMLSMVLVSAGIPVEGIALIAGIDRLFDMGRTTLNVVGDVVGTIVVDNMDLKASQGRKAA